MLVDLPPAVVCTAKRGQQWSTEPTHSGLTRGLPTERVTHPEEKENSQQPLSPKQIVLEYVRFFIEEFFDIHLCEHCMYTTPA